MSNRYSKTGFTSRDDDRLQKMEHSLLDIIGSRSGKNDSPKALSQLFAAQAAISQARYLSKEWKKWQ